MNFKKTTLSLTTFLFMVLICYSQAGATLFLGDWGISYDNWAPGGTAPAYVVYNAGGSEDYVGGLENYGYVDPGYGGQCFDAEAIYFGIDYNISKAYIAVISGTPFFGGTTYWANQNWYMPGDIAIDIGNNGYDSAISASALNTFYQGVTDWTPPDSYLTSAPYKQANGTAATIIQSAYTLMSQDNGGYRDKYGSTDEDLNSANVRNPDYKGYSTENGINAEHWAFEAIVDLDLLGIGYNESFKIHWTQECGNDVIELTGVTLTAAPEPATMLLLGSGLIGLGWIGRRKTKKGSPVQ